MPTRRLNLRSLVRFVRGAQVIAIIVLLAMAYAFILPDEGSVERELEIASGPEFLFEQFNDLERFSGWSPWFSAAEDGALEIEEPSNGLGARMNWEGMMSSIPSGALEITTSVPYKILETTTELGNGNLLRTNITIYNNSDNSRCRVVWSTEVSFEGWVQKYLGLLLDRRLGPDIELGLISLKYLAETGQPYPGLQVQ